MFEGCRSSALRPRCCLPKNSSNALRTLKPRWFTTFPKLSTNHQSKHSFCKKGIQRLTRVRLPPQLHTQSFLIGLLGQAFSALILCGFLLWFCIKLTMGTKVVVLLAAERWLERAAGRVVLSWPRGDIWDLAHCILDPEGFFIVPSRVRYLLHPPWWKSVLWICVQRRKVALRGSVITRNSAKDAGYNWDLRIQTQISHQWPNAISCIQRERTTEEHEG